MGAKSVTQSLAVLFSPRELRAFDLLTRLDQSESALEEVQILQKISKSESLLTQSELVGYLNSPRFEVRSEALHALESIPVLDTETIGALIREVKNNAYTTAYVAARILGKQRAKVAVPVLIESIDGPDYMLQSMAMVRLRELVQKKQFLTLKAKFAGPTTLVCAFQAPMHSSFLDRSIQFPRLCPA